MAERQQGLVQARNRRAGDANASSTSSTTNAATIATWGNAGSIRYFAVDGTNGNDNNLGYSDVSQAAAGLVAVRTIGQLLLILPRLGNGRKVRVAIRAGSYTAEGTRDFSGFEGYANFYVTGTDTVPSAGAVAFAGDSNDAICAGLTTATGMNAAGYNPTAYAVDGEGTPTMTVQLAGGGAPGFGANPNRPYGCRIRFDAATTTAALRNKCTAVISVSGGNTLMLSTALGTNPVAGDVFYIEMPNVVVSQLNCISASGTSLIEYFVGISATGAIVLNGLGVGLSACEAGSLLAQQALITARGIATDPTNGGKTQGVGFRATSAILNNSNLNITDSVATGAMTFSQSFQLIIERFACAGMVIYGGGHSLANNIQETVGSNSSTGHGATAQIWAPLAAPPQGTLKCGLACYGSYQLGRIKFSNMGNNPAVRIAGPGVGLCVQGLSGGVADGNTDVGVDLSPNGLTTNTTGAMGCSIALVGSPAVTGTLGDIRLPDGTITTWANATAGILDASGNRLFGAGNAPDHFTPVAAGAVAVTITNAPAGSPATPARYIKIPDGAGGFYTIPSLT